MGKATAFVQCLQRPFAASHFGNDLLRKHVKRSLGRADAVELAALHRIEQRRALQQVVQRQREQASLGNRADGVPGATHALHEGVDRTR